VNVELAAPSNDEPRDPFERVDVVVTNYNGAEHLKHALPALARQGARLGDVRILDNASTDDSARVAAEIAPAAELVALATNGGPCPARNAGLAAARTPWVLLVDNDAVLEDGVLEKLVAAARANPRAAIVQPRSVFASEPSRVHYDGGELHYVGLFSLRNFYSAVASARGAGTIEVGGAVSVAMLVRRELVLELGAFDESFFILFEDLDLSLRVRMAGWTILSVEDAIVLHRGGTPGISFREGKYPSSRAFLHSRNRWLHLVKNHRWRTLVVCAPALCAYELAWACFCAASGTLGDYLRGKLAFARQCGAALRARRAIQARRVRADRELLVGGPLTIAPQVERGRASTAALALLDAFLRAWWKLARVVAG
jgi:GT2 family glycosyltransferase